MVKNTQKIVLITGASSGIGKDVAFQLLAKGYKVYGAARRTDLLEPLKEKGGIPLYLDLTNDSSISECVNAILKQEDRIDILINNAGYGLGGPLEAVPVDEGRRQFEVNLFGLARLVQLILPVMRKYGNGRIINIASVAGRIAPQYLGWYNATKFAVEGYSDSLRREVSEFGIKVVVIEPGLIQTNWGVIAGNSISQYCENTAYQKTGSKVAKFLEENYASKKSASKVSIITRLITRAAVARHPRIRYHAGKLSSLAVFAYGVFSDRLIDFILRLIFSSKKTNKEDK